MKGRHLDAATPRDTVGRLIGGVGVSGGTVPQDVEVALAGVAGIGASSTAPMY